MKRRQAAGTACRRWWARLTLFRRAGYEQFLEEGRGLRGLILPGLIGLDEQDAVPAGEVVGGHIHMEPAPLHVHEVSGVGLAADGEAGDVRRPAQELHCSGVGTAGRFQLPGMGGEGLGDAGCFSLLVGQQGAEVVVEGFHPFPVRHLLRGLNDRLDEVQGHLVIFRHLGGYGEVIQVLPVVGEALGHMVFIPQHTLHAPNQLFHRAVVLLGHHGVGGGGSAGPVQHRLADGVVQLPAVHAGEHLRAGLLREVLPAPVVRADGVGFWLQRWGPPAWVGTASRAAVMVPASSRGRVFLFFILDSSVL